MVKKSKNGKWPISVLIIFAALIGLAEVRPAFAQYHKKQGQIDVGGGFFDADAAATPTPAPAGRDKYGNEINSKDDPNGADSNRPESIDGAIGDTNDLYALPAQRTPDPRDLNSRKSQEQKQAERVIDEVRRKLDENSPKFKHSR